MDAFIERSIRLYSMTSWAVNKSLVERTTQPRFTIGHSLLFSGRAASSAGTVASSLR
jgi:hypothetical protein